MIDLAKCRECADRVDSAGIKTNSIIKYYNDASYYIKKNESADSTFLSTKILNNEKQLLSIKQDLVSIATLIRNRSLEIYNDEMAEIRRKKEIQNQEYEK